MSKFKKLTFWKSIGLIFAGIMLLLIASSYIILSYWEPIISKSIKESFYRSTNKLYRIDFDDITFNVFLGNFGLKNIRLTPDLKVYEQLKAKKEQPAYLFNLSIDKAKVHGLDIYSLYNLNELKINEISVNNPNVLVINDLSYKKSDKDTSIFRNPYDLIKSQLHFLKVEQINLKNINLEFVADSLGKTKKKKIFLAYFKVRNLFIDSLSQYDSTRPFYSDDIKISIKHFTHPFKDSVNTMQIEEAVASTATSSIQVYNFKIIPKLNEAQFKDLKGFRKTRIDLYVKEANLNKVDFKKLFFEQKLYGGSIDINKMESKIYLNKLFPKNPKKKSRFPAELVYDIRIPFHFQNVNIKNSKLVYSEIDRKSNYRWEILFSDLKGKVENFSNDSSYLRKNQFANIVLDANFNNSGSSHFEFVLDYVHPLKPFYVKGFFSNYNLKGVNPILANLAHLEVSNCNLRTLRFVLNGDKRDMNCNISMIYNNLKVKILEFNEEENKLQKHGLLTLLANNMVLQSENPRSNGKFIKSRFLLKRENDLSFFGFIWKAILRGMKESVGIDQRMEKELKYQADRYSDFRKFTKQLKENREQRKSERIKNRNLRRQERDKKKTSMNIDSTSTQTNFN